MTPQRKKLFDIANEYVLKYEAGELSYGQAEQGVSQVLKAIGFDGAKLDQAIDKVLGPEQSATSQNLQEMGQQLQHFGTNFVEGTADILEESGRREPTEEEWTQMGSGGGTQYPRGAFTLGEQVYLPQKMQTTSMLTHRRGPIDPELQAVDKVFGGAQKADDFAKMGSPMEALRRPVTSTMGPIYQGLVEEGIKPLMHQAGKDLREYNKEDAAKVPTPSTTGGAVVQSLGKSSPSMVGSIVTGVGAGGAARLGGKAASQVAGRVTGTGVGLLASPAQLAAETNKALEFHPVLRQAMTNLNDAEKASLLDSMKAVANKEVFNEKFLNEFQVLQATGAAPVGGILARILIDAGQEGIEEGFDDTVITGIVANMVVRNYLKSINSPLANDPTLTTNRTDWILENPGQVAEGALLGSLAGLGTSTPITMAEVGIEKAQQNAAADAAAEQEAIANEALAELANENITDVTLTPGRLQGLLNNIKVVPKERHQELYKLPGTQRILKDLSVKAQTEQLSTEETQILRWSVKLEDDLKNGSPESTPSGESKSSDTQTSTKTKKAPAPDPNSTGSGPVDSASILMSKPAQGDLFQGFPPKEGTPVPKLPPPGGMPIGPVPKPPPVETPTEASGIDAPYTVDQIESRLAEQATTRKREPAELPTQKLMEPTESGIDSPYTLDQEVAQDLANQAASRKRPSAELPARDVTEPTEIGFDGPLMGQPGGMKMGRSRQPLGEMNEDSLTTRVEDDEQQAFDAGLVESDRRLNEYDQAHGPVKIKGEERARSSVDSKVSKEDQETARQAFEVELSQQIPKAVEEVVEQTFEPGSLEGDSLTTMGLDQQNQEAEQKAYQRQLLLDQINRMQQSDDQKREYLKRLVKDRQERQRVEQDDAAANQEFMDAGAPRRPRSVSGMRVGSTRSVAFDGNQTTTAGNGLTVAPDTKRGAQEMRKRTMEVLVDTVRKHLPGVGKVHVVNTLEEAQQIEGAANFGGSVFEGVSYRNTKTGELEAILVTDVLEASNGDALKGLLKRGVEVIYHEDIGHNGLHEMMGEEGFTQYAEEVYAARQDEIDSWYASRYGADRVSDAKDVKAKEWLAQVFTEKGVQYSGLRDLIRATFGKANNDASIRRTYNKIYQGLKKGKRPKLKGAQGKADGRKEEEKQTQTKPDQEQEQEQVQETTASPEAQAATERANAIKDAQTKLESAKKRVTTAETAERKKFAQEMVKRAEKNLNEVYEKYDPGFKEFQDAEAKKKAAEDAKKKAAEDAKKKAAEDAKKKAAEDAKKKQQQNKTTTKKDNALKSEPPAGVAALFSEVNPASIVTWFSGGGTLEAALTNVTSLDAVEYSQTILEHYNEVHGTNYSPKDINAVNAREVGRMNPDLFHASPVCKNFSKAKTLKGATDLDRASAEQVAEVIVKAQPPVVTIENVPDYADTALFKVITDALDLAGYNYDTHIHDAADYGSPQSRKRMILRAVKDGDLPPVPEKTGPTDWYELLKEDLENAPDAPFTTRTKPVNWEMERIQNMINRGSLDPNLPIIAMGGSAGASVANARNSGGPSPTLLASHKQKVRVIYPDGRVKLVTPEMMRKLMGLPDSYPLPQEGRGEFTNAYGLAKTILGNGVSGYVTRAFIQPLVNRPNTNGTTRSNPTQDVDDGVLFSKPVKPTAQQLQQFPSQLTANDILDGIEVPNLEGGSYVRNLGLKPVSAKVQNIDIADYLDRRSKKVHGTTAPLMETDAVYDAVAETMNEEINRQLNEDSSGIGWYDKALSDALGMYALKYPELKTDPGAANVFKSILAITSQGLTVHQNGAQTDDLYGEYKRTGRVPARASGDKKAAIIENLKLLQSLLDAYSPQDLNDLFNAPMTVRDINALRKLYGRGPVQELVDTVLVGSAVFGPKIGVFNGNLNGNFNLLTIDIWMNRTLSRYFGEIKAFNKSLDTKYRKQLNELWDKQTFEPSKTVKKRPKGDKLINRWAKETLNHYAAPVPTGKTKPDGRPETRSYHPSRKTDQSQNAKNLIENLFATNDAPTNANRRRARALVEKVHALRAKNGEMEINTADLQAVLWYYEKDLFQKLGGGSKSSEKADYVDAAESVIARGDDAEQLSGAQNIRARRSTPEPGELTALRQKLAGNKRDAGGGSGADGVRQGTVGGPSQSELAGQTDDGSTSGQSEVLFSEPTQDLASDPQDDSFLFSKPKKKPVSDAKEVAEDQERLNLAQKAWRKVTKFFDPKHYMQNRKDWEFLVQKMRGAQTRAIQMGKDMADVFHAASKLDPSYDQLLLDFFTTAGADPNMIPDVEIKIRKGPILINKVPGGGVTRNYGSLREAAVKTKQQIFRNGQDLVRLGVLPQEVFDANADAYLPRVILRYLMDENGKVIRAGGDMKASDLGYLKRKKDIDKLLMKGIMGVVEDPAYLSARTLIQVGQDIPLMDLFRTVKELSTPERDPLTGEITKEAQQDWMLEGALTDINYANIINKVIVDRGLDFTQEGLPAAVRQTQDRRVTPEFLRAEADRLQTRMKDVYGENTQLGQLVDGVANEFNKIANAMRADVSNYKSQGYAKLPDSPRYGDLRGAWIAKEIYDQLVGSGDAFAGSVPVLRELVAGVDWTTAQFKAWAVAANPVAWGGNMASNTHQIHAAGVPMYMIPLYRAKAIKALFENYKGEPSDQFNRFRDEGLILSTFAANELDQVTIRLWPKILSSEKRMSELVKQQLSSPLDGANGWAMTKRVFNAIDNQYTIFKDYFGDRYQDLELMDKLTIAMYLEDNGASAAEAIWTANEYLFDYTDVPQWLRVARRNILGAPFLTWAYKAAPRLAKDLSTVKGAMRSGMYYMMVYGAFKALMEADLTDEEREAFYAAQPPGRKYRGPFVIPAKWLDDNGKPVALDLSMWFPHAMFVNALMTVMPDAIQEKWHGSEFNLIDASKDLGFFSHPLLNTIVEVQSNRDTFTGRKIYNPDGDNAWGEVGSHVGNNLVPLNFWFEVAEQITGVNPVPWRDDSMIMDSKGRPKNTLTTTLSKLSGVRGYAFDGDDQYKYRGYALKEQKKDRAKYYDELIAQSKDPAERAELRREKAAEMRMWNDKIRNRPKAFKPEMISE